MLSERSDVQADQEWEWETETQKLKVLRYDGTIGSEFGTQEDRNTPEVGPTRSFLLSWIPDPTLGRLRSAKADRDPMILNPNPPPRPRGYPGKRLLDVVLAGLALVVLAPLLAALALAVWFSLGRPVFFRQERPGFLGRPFRIVKFRTMNEARDARGNLLPDGQRLTRLGSFLRRTSLDELPELWNVLRGEMSLVGPRPLLMRYLPYFRPRERLRFEVRPGITGLAQVSGRNCVGWDQRLELDARYVESMSLGLDFRIMWWTLVTVVRSEGVSADVDQVETWLDEERSAALTASSAEAGLSDKSKGG